MKIYNLEEIGNMSQDECQEVLLQRAQMISFMIHKTLKGKTIKAFGASNELGGNEELLIFEIQDIEPSQYGITPIENKSNYMIPINISLEKYCDNESYGVKFGDKKAEKALRKLFKNLLGDQYKIKWSDENVQGDKYITMDLIIPATILAHDFLRYEKSKTKKIKP